MGWKSVKLANKRRPAGSWRQFRCQGEAIVHVKGLRQRREAVFAFLRGCAIADDYGLDWGVRLEREPSNPYDRNAIKVIGHWIDRRKPWFRPAILTPKQAHIGYVEREFAAAIAKLGPIPITAEIYEIAVADDAIKRDDVMGVIIKIILLIPTARDPIWREPGVGRYDG